jgi:L-seryl-tRNA(Ser) seleniumtransferase
MSEEALRQIPSVDAVLQTLNANAESTIPVAIAVSAARNVLAQIRNEALAGTSVPALTAISGLVQEAAGQMLAPSLRPVINATGVLLQTNLGRAPLSERAIEAINSAATGYTNLEFDLAEGARGSRHDHVRSLIHTVTGAEDGIAVNNNAAGIMMALEVFAEDREVIISRGEAVEIGGGFRIPDVLSQSGVTLVEVGTTNRTYARDYGAAITGETAAILRVHRSNFAIVGFTAQPELTDLVDVVAGRDVLVFDDLGSGCLIDTARYGIAHEPTVQESVEAGVDLVFFSGDKLIGGPQCGIIAGRTELIDKLRAHPLARALRVDKLTIAALNSTLQSYAAGLEAEEIPLWRMLSATDESLRQRARRWTAAAGDTASIVDGLSVVGGGALPGEGVRTPCAAVRAAMGAEKGAEFLRRWEFPIVARVEGGAIILDPRSVSPADDIVVEAALTALISKNLS